MTNTRITRTAPTPGWLWKLPATAALLALSALVLPLPSSFAGAGLGGGDGDAVGSLPSTHANGPGAGEHGLLEALGEQFRLTLVGDKAQIRSLVKSYTPGANGGYQLEEFGVPGLVRYSFWGNVTLEIDRALLEASFVSVQVDLGPIYSGGYLKVSFGQVTSRTAAVPGVLPLHLQQLSWSQVIERGAELRATTKLGTSRALGLSTGGANNELIVLNQKD